MCILHCRTNHSTSYMYMYICTAVLFSVVSCRVLCQLLWTVPAAVSAATGTLPASTKQIDCRNSYDCCTFPGTLYQLYQLLYMYNYELVPAVPAASTKAASTKAASTKLYQLLSSRCQLLSSGCQLLSSRCQLLSSECQLIFKIRQYQNISGICTS